MSVAVGSETLHWPTSRQFLVHATEMMLLLLVNLGAVLNGAHIDRLPNFLFTLLLRLLDVRSGLLLCRAFDFFGTCGSFASLSHVLVKVSVPSSIVLNSKVSIAFWVGGNHTLSLTERCNWLNWMDHLVCISTLTIDHSSLFLS